MCRPAFLQPSFDLNAAWSFHCYLILNEIFHVGGLKFINVAVAGYPRNGAFFFFSFSFFLGFCLYISPTRLLSSSTANELLQLFCKIVVIVHILGSS